MGIVKFFSQLLLDFQDVFNKRLLGAFSFRDYYLESNSCFFCCLWWSKSKMQILLLIVISSVVLTLLPWKIGYIKQPSLEAESEHRAQPLHSPKRSVFLTNDHIMQHRTIYFLRKDEQRRSVAKQNSHQDNSKKFSIILIYRLVRPEGPSKQMYFFANYNLTYMYFLPNNPNGELSLFSRCNHDPPI